MHDLPFIITHWYGIPPSFIRTATGEIDLSRLQQMKDAGFNLVSVAYDSETNRDVLRACETLGLRVTLTDNRLDTLLAGAPGWEQLAAQMVDDYRDCPALFNYHVKDEPNNRDFPALARVSASLARLDPCHAPYINLFPNYATPAQLGAPDYDTHVTDFIRKVSPTLISYDHYHFCRRRVQKESHEFADERARLIYENAFLSVNRAGFFDNLEVIRRRSLEAGLPYMIIVLVVEHGSYRNVTEGELRFEVFQSLAYGVSGISYFTYWTPIADGDDVWHWQHGMISKDGQPDQHYYDVAKINRELAALTRAMRGEFDERRPAAVHPLSTAVFHAGPRETDEHVTPFPPEGFGNVRSVSDSAVTLGFFENGMLLLANRRYQAPETVTLTFAPQISPALFDVQSMHWQPLQDAKSAPDAALSVSLTLAPGDAALLRL